MSEDNMEEYYILFLVKSEGFNLASTIKLFKHDYATVGVLIMTSEHLYLHGKINTPKQSKAGFKKN